MGSYGSFERTKSVHGHCDRDDVITTTQNNTEALNDASKDVRLNVNTRKLRVS
jgi:hypothetical protein